MEPGRILVVADWTVDAHAVVDTVRRVAGAGARRVALLVPAWLHGLDWAGDPHASRPCAETQLARITYLATRANLEFDVAAVGDPDPVTAIMDVVHEWPADELLLCLRRRRLGLGHPVLGRRAARSTGLETTRIEVTVAGLRGRGGTIHCTPGAALRPQF
jgi:hypothetical protein